MTATYNTVTIDGTEYDVYATDADADVYLAAEATADATKWRDATKTSQDDKKRALVSATRLIDRQVWAGTKTDEFQELAWPRDSVGVDGVTDGVIPQQIIDASILLAASINNGGSAITSQSTASLIKRQKAGSVEIERFKDLSGGSRFPTAVEELLRQLRGSAAFGGTEATGTDTCASLKQGYEPNVIT